jgi:hypothetical protein
MYKIRNAVLYLPYIYLNIGTVLWGGWTGAMVYSKTVSFLQNNSENKERYEITIPGLVISGAIGSIITGGISYKYLLT